MIRQQLEAIAAGIRMDLPDSTTGRFNFDLDGIEYTEQFHILLENGSLVFRDGLHTDALGLVRASQRTLISLLTLGSSMIESLLDLSFRQLPGQIEVPDIKTRVSVSTELEKRPVHFNLFIEQNQLCVIEDTVANGDIRIRIKPGFLPGLLSEKINLPMAILTGKIKISNKAALLKLLAKLGLKM